jgi:hypothetical protein
LVEQPRLVQDGDPLVEPVVDEATTLLAVAVGRHLADAVVENADLAAVLLETDARLGRHETQVMAAAGGGLAADLEGGHDRDHLLVLVGELGSRSGDGLGGHEEGRGKSVGVSLLLGRLAEWRVEIDIDEAPRRLAVAIEDVVAEFVGGGETLADIRGERADASGSRRTAPPPTR